MSIFTNNNFEVVYYSFPVPTNPLTVSLLGILFDKILLPGVYLPSKFDKKMVADRFNFLTKHYDPQDGMSAQREMLGTLQFVHNYYGELQDIFIPTGKSGHMGILEKETHPVILQLEELIYGPPPTNFTPTPNMGFNQPAGNDQINAPSWISYPANALVYSRKNGLPLLSDSNLLPFPNTAVALSEIDTKVLATYLMAASFSLVLPKIRALKAEEILEVREKMKDDISLFKVAMLSGVNKYMQLMGNNPTVEQLEKQARHIAQTDVYPKVEELRLRFESSKSIIFKKFIDLALDAPELALNFQKPEDFTWSVMKVFANVAKKVKEGLDQYQNQTKHELTSGLSLLLKIQRGYSR